MFKGYISNTIGHVRWIIDTQQTFLIPFLERMPYRLRGQVKETSNDPPLNILRKDRYKVLGEFEVSHANKAQGYLVKVYKYPQLFQKIKYLFKPARAFHEFNTTYVAAMKGVPVEVPLAYGEWKHLFDKESYLIIRKIKHCYTTREYFKRDSPLKERRNVLRKFGKLAKNIHDSGVKQDDFSLDNFLVYSDETVEKKVILIDFERVSVQAKPLSEKNRIWYLAKLNRAKRFFTNTDRLRFLLSYTDDDFEYCKKLANDIEALTVRIQKRDAQKFHKQCIHENRKFCIFKDTYFSGHYRKQYSLETMLTLLGTIGETTLDILYRNHFQILRFTEQPGGNQPQNRGQGSGLRDQMSAIRNPIPDPRPLSPSKARFNYDAVTQVWMHANALFALRINVLVPIGVFKSHLPNLPKEGFLISRMPDNCMSLHQYVDLYPDNDLLRPALLRFVEQVSPFGTFTKDLDTQDILIQTHGNRLTCYLGNYTSFFINRLSTQKNRSVNTHIIKPLLQMNDR